MNKLKELLPNPKKCVLCVLGACVLAFGLYNVHSISCVTEGGVLGIALLLEHWLDISPAVSGFILNAVCYLLGIKILGKDFLVYSAISAAAFSGFYALFEQFNPVYPAIADYPVAAAVIGAVFVGVGVGLCVRAGGAPTGDDALAMSISSRIPISIRWVYLASDLTVLALSLTYIEPKRIVYSLLSVVLSGQIIGFIEKVGKKKK